MKRIFALLLAGVLLLSVPKTAHAKQKKDEIKAKSAVLMCLDTGDIIVKKNEKERLSPASVTKIMTILLVLEALDSHKITLSDKVTASENAVKMGGSQIWLEAGESMTVDELLKAVVIASANDACTALSEYIGGSTTAFVKMMNDRARELGCKNTNFENCNGLDDTITAHYSSAEDLAIITREVMKHKVIKKYTTVWLDSLRDGKTELNNTNKLINSYNGITGLKTGTTSNAGFCIAATAEREGMSLVAVVLKSDTSEDRFNTARYLLDYGFANYEVITPEIDAKKIKPVKVVKGVFKEVTPKAINSDKFLIEKGADNIEYKYSIIMSTKAPVKKHEKLGKITVKSGKKTLGEISLVSPNDISKTDKTSIFRDILIKI
ncbi:MAG: D-alanyl-D-alanine carboxypeptidase [Eubacterium sp.]|nr:D-alanyl-D-alanine carboxypeptidase [Eubacterium sp.]